MPTAVEFSPKINFTVQFGNKTINFTCANNTHGILIGLLHASIPPLSARSFAINWCDGSVRTGELVPAVQKSQYISALIGLLRPYLAGNGKIMILGNLSPALATELTQLAGVPVNGILGNLITGFTGGVFQGFTGGV
jgi:hypothetical protein